MRACVVQDVTDADAGGFAATAAASTPRHLARVFSSFATLAWSAQVPSAATTPGSRAAGVAARNAATVAPPSRTATASAVPLAAADASFASSLFGPQPTYRATNRAKRNHRPDAAADGHGQLRRALDGRLDGDAERARGGRAGRLDLRVALVDGRALDDGRPAAERVLEGGEELAARGVVARVVDARAGPVAAKRVHERAAARLDERPRLAGPHVLLHAAGLGRAVRADHVRVPITSKWIEFEKW